MPPVRGRGFVLPNQRRRGAGFPLVARRRGQLRPCCPLAPLPPQTAALTPGSATSEPPTMQRASRLKRELSLLTTEPPPGITCWQEANRVDELRAQIVGGAGTPYEKGIFDLEILVPERYPFEPPRIRFLTPIYHPNIDSAGRICLDVLKLPPKGAWSPSLNISTLLTSIQLLMAEPNPNDPLMASISSEYKYKKELFLLNAREWTEKHASQQKRALGEKLEPSATGAPEGAAAQKRKGSSVSKKEKSPRLES